jgi:acetyl-CoA carboxylase carboxyltransferase component
VPLTEGLAFDEATFRLRLSQSVAGKKSEYDAWEAERQTAAEASGAGAVTGLGTSSGTSTVDVAKVHENLAASYEARGLSKEAARLAAFGRPA